MKKIVGVKLSFDDDDWTELECTSGLGLDDIHNFIDEKAKPKAPLIKDEKIRKAVRAWWNIQENPFKGASVLCKSYSGIPNNEDHDGFYNYCIYGYVGRGNINLTATDFEFRTKTYFKYDRNKDYTLEELCGEEEE